jgi:hypothetical protein
MGLYITFTIWLDISVLDPQSEKVRSEVQEIYIHLSNSVS